MSPSSPRWLVAGFRSSPIVGLLVARGALSSFPHGPLHSAVSKMAAGNIRVKERFRASKMEVQSLLSHFGSNILSLLSHPCIKRESLSLAHPQGGGGYMNTRRQGSLGAISETTCHHFFRERHKDVGDKHIPLYFYKCRDFTINWGCLFKILVGFLFLFLFFLMAALARGWIRAASSNYAATWGNAGSLTHWSRPGIEPASSQTQYQALNPLSHKGEL